MHKPFFPCDMSCDCVMSFFFLIELICFSFILNQYKFLRIRYVMNNQRLKKGINMYYRCIWGKIDLMYHFEGNWLCKNTHGIGRVQVKSRVGPKIEILNFSSLK